MFETAKNKTVAATEGTGHVVEKVEDTTAKVLTTTVKDTKKVAVGAEHATAAVVGGAVKATGEVGTAAVNSIHKVVAKPAHKSAVKEFGLAAAKN
jgi:hypothetical protein